MGKNISKMTSKNIHMASEQDVIDLLTKAYVDEVETTINYLSHAINLDTFDGRDVAEELLQDVQNEQDHAQQLGERIRVHNEKVPMSLEDNMDFSQNSLNNIEDTTDVIAVIDGVIEAEKDAIETYKRLVEVARDVGDVGTASLAETLLRDEENHLREFRSLRKQFE
jgi:bacterioferritin